VYDTPLGAAVELPFFFAPDPPACAYDVSLAAAAAPPLVLAPELSAGAYDTAVASVVPAPGPPVGARGAPLGAMVATPPPPAAISLWDAVDATLQRRLERRLQLLGLGRAVAEKRLAVTLVDIAVVRRPRVAAVNGDEMMYAASLPKIAILLGAFERISEGTLILDAQAEREMVGMIRDSSNTDASAMMDRVGKEYIANVLQSPRYQLYDERRNGGLWVGKNYAQTGLWRRDPLHNLSHGATAMQVARFYYLLETGDLVSPEYSRRMKTFLANSSLDHKFFRGIKERFPQATVYRKSGTWGHFHADSALIEHDGRRYIAVALCQSDRGSQWLRDIVVALDDIVSVQPQIVSVAKRWAAKRRLRQQRQPH
jgi:beta-lactamase class A